MAEYLTTLAGPIIALSGWGKVLYDHVTSRPKICGRVFQVVLGQMANPAQAEEPLAAFVVYLYLVNRRRIPSIFWIMRWKSEWPANGQDSPGCMGFITSTTVLTLPLVLSKLRTLKPT